MRLFLREHERAGVYAREVRTARNNAYIVATASQAFLGTPLSAWADFFIGKHKRKNSLRASNQSSMIAKPEKIAFYAYVTYMRLFLREHERDTRDFAQESALRAVDWLQNRLVLWAFMTAKCERQEITLILSPRRRGLCIVRGGIFICCECRLSLTPSLRLLPHKRKHFRGPLSQAAYLLTNLFTPCFFICKFVNDLVQ